MQKELKVGIFTVSVIVASFFVLNYLRGKDLFNREFEVVSQFEDVQGLVVSAPVYIKGYKAGKVSKVSYESEKGYFDVVCSVRKEFAIPVGSRMVIYSTDIMGGKGIRIDLADSPESVQDGDTLTTGFEAGLMDGLAESVGPLMNKVSTTLDSLNTTVSSLNRLMSEANVATISRTLKHLETTVENVKGLARSVNGKSGEINDLIDNLNEFSSGLKHLSERIDSTVTGVNDIVANVSEADISGVVTSFKNLLDNINDPEGTFGKLLREDSVYNSVDSLLVDLNSLIQKIQENPKKYLKISVF
jgi:phospholipid/cholesterol/gamma-HCH transport system substrate-binding protein